MGLDCTGRLPHLRIPAAAAGAKIGLQALESNQHGSTAMKHHASIPHVGAQDPELRNSPIAEEEDEDTDVIRQQVPGEPVCWFNAAEYKHGAYVVSGTRLLQCNRGVWVESAAEDAANL
jgi:hypothetical protein